MDAITEEFINIEGGGNFTISIRYILRLIQQPVFQAISLVYRSILLYNR